MKRSKNITPIPYIANETARNSVCPKCGSTLVNSTYNRNCGKPYSCIRDNCNKMCDGCHDYVSSSGQISIELHCIRCHHTWTVLRRM